MVEVSWCLSLFSVLLFVALYLCSQLQLVPAAQRLPPPTFPRENELPEQCNVVIAVSLGHRIRWGMWDGWNSYQLVLLMPICPSLPLAEELGGFFFF